jgi:hypothetical protein
VLPWLHADLMHLSKAGDPKVLVLAALGGWLAQMLTRERAGTRDEVTSTRREIAQVIYRVTWLLLFGVSGRADPAALGGALRRLLEGWCDCLLWKGPVCCGDPHGVVIGCALVEGGSIQGIDPFGGRRWVVHYPLLEHWGAQFGIAPPDVLASRFFAKLCCVADLNPFGVASREVPAALVALGAGHLAVGDPGRIADRLRDQGLNDRIVDERRVALPEMIVSAVLLASAGAARPTQESQFTKLVLSQVVADQTVILLYPVRS